MLVPSRTAAEQPPGVARPGPAHAVVAADASGMIVSWDDAAWQLYGLAAGQVVGVRNVGDLFGPPLDGVPAMRDLLGQLRELAPAPAVWAGEVECRHASGHWFTADVVVTPFHSRDGASAGLALTCRPARTADAFGAQVWSKLSHELRSPLAGIIGLTRILLLRLDAGQADAATQVRQLELVQASAARSLATIEQVVDLARLGSGQIVPVPALVDCAGVIAEVAAKLQDSAAERGLRLRVDVPPHPVMVSSDPGMLGQLLAELAANGLRFADGGEVRIRLQASHGAVVIEVSDDGPGIPAEEQTRIFEPFERGANAAERDDSAPGLGLHLAARRAALLGAQLSLRSQTGTGSTFSVTFADPHNPPGPAPIPNPRS